MLRLPANEVVMTRFKSPLNKLDGYSKLWAMARWILQGVTICTV